MRQTGRRIAALLLAALFSLPGSCLVARAEPEQTAPEQPAPEQTQPEQAPANLAVPVEANAVSHPEVNCTYALCYDLNFEKTLLDKGADAVIAPASFTKLMTALLGFEYRRDAGNVPVTVTEEMISDASGIGLRLKAGEELDLDSLLKGLVVYNANDAALVVAGAVGGSISAFVERMNARAEELGMENTYYSNPTGVDSAVMHTTLRDTLILCRTLYRINDYMTLSSEERGSIPATNLSEERVFTNRNALIPYSYVTDYMVNGARGFVAGGTVMAGYVCATSRESGEANTFVLLAGGSDLSENQNGSQLSTYRDAARLLDWARNEYAVVKVVEKETVVCERKVRLSGGLDHTVLLTGSDLKALLPKSVNVKEDIRTEIRTDGDSLDAPILKGNKYGEADLYWGEEKLGTVDLVAQANVSISRFLQVADNVIRFFSAGPARVFLIIVISSAALYLVVLIGTVYVQYLRNTKERRQVIREMEERENRRLREVRRTERERAQRTLRRARSAVREGYRVFSGQSDVLGSGKAVARVPEKYRRIATEAPPRPGKTTDRLSSRRRPPSRPASPGKGRQPIQTNRRQQPTERYRATPVGRRPEKAPKKPGPPGPGRQDRRPNVKKWPN
ncbi:MAG: D-alanyl-D-alanine carboxypeptidase [Clostridia bacterium]|nr:D-alanyl-D-alanine carboxypeptidase [Clostridia bacterium]